jgi:hypothetical protein
MRSLNAETTDPQAAVRDGAPSQAERDGRVARDKKDIGDHFASAALIARENKTIGSTLAAVADPNFRFLGAGVSQITVTDVVVNGTTATIQASANVWSKFEQKMDDGSWSQASPTAEKIYTTTLSMGPAGTWLVTDQTESFANGSGP